MNDIVGRIAKLSPEKRALLEQRVTTNPPLADHQPEIKRKEWSGPPPQSFAQQRREPDTAQDWVYSDKRKHIPDRSGASAHLLPRGMSGPMTPRPAG